MKNNKTHKIHLFKDFNNEEKLQFRLKSWKRSALSYFKITNGKQVQCSALNGRAVPCVPSSAKLPSVQRHMNSGHSYTINTTTGDGELQSILTILLDSPAWLKGNVWVP